MDGTQLSELRLFKQMSIPEALNTLAAGHGITEAQWKACETSGTRPPAAVEAVWGLFKLPRSKSTQTVNGRPWP